MSTRYNAVAILVFGLMTSSTALLAADAGVVSITLPAPDNMFKPGPNSELANTVCTICHAADYIYTQPPLAKEKWTATIKKMQEKFGCPIQDADIDKLADYLVSQNGPK